MNGFVSILHDALIQAKCPSESIHFERKLELPGWFRSEKKWDLVVIHEGHLIAAMEFKSQTGPSFGNNFNNRTEEAIGSATDLWASYREGAFKPSPRPWLGYFMLLDDCDASASPVRVSEPHFKVFPEFVDSSYRRRYELFIQKLVRDRLYDAGCFLLAPSAFAAKGQYSEPNLELAFSPFVRSVQARIACLGN